MTQTSPIVLRDYQEAGLNKARQMFSEKRRSVLICSPTGSGKGTLAAYVLSQAAAKGRRSIFVVHRREIIMDVAKRLENAGAHVGIVQAGVPLTRGAMVQVCSVATLFARGERPQADFVFWDEAHHATATMYRKVREAYPHAQHLGATATPERADRTPLGDIFEAIVPLASVQELQRRGFLVRCTVLSPEETTGQDLAQDPVDYYLARADGTRAFMFVRREVDCERYARIFRDRGVPAVAITGKTPGDVRTVMLRRFREGHERVIVNVNTMTEGVDVPEAVTCILARKMDSVAQFIQATGRVLRAAPNKTHAVVLDMCGNSKRHGLPQDDRPYSLDHGIGDIGDEDPIEPCKRCGALDRHSVFAWNEEGCSSCGWKRAKREYSPGAEQEVLNVPMLEYGEQLPLPLEAHG